MNITEYHQATDKVMLAIERQHTVTCRAGCWWCCYEAAYADEREVDHMLENFGPDELERIRSLTKVWVERTKPLIGSLLPDAVMWRKLMAPCPFLKGGLCSAYDRRPFGCRTFFTVGDPENCELTHRKDQVFGQINIETIVRLNTSFMDRKSVMDHIGAFLAEKLLGIKINSKARHPLR